MERERSYFASHGHRRCVVVVGDKPGDADVTVGLAPDERCLKIGFFDHSHEHPHPDLPPLPPPPPPRTPEAAVAAVAAAASNGEIGLKDFDNDRIPESFRFFLSETNSGSWMLLEGSNTTNTSSSSSSSAAATAAPDVEADARDSGVAAVAAARGDDATAATVGGGGALVSSEDSVTVLGRPGSQGGGEVFSFCSADDAKLSGEEDEERRCRPNAPVAAEELLRAYGDRFDVVACGGHSMGLVADFVRHFVGSSSPDETVAKENRGVGCGAVGE